MAIQENSIDTYWKNTSAFGTINKYISMNFDGLENDIMEMLAGNSIPVDVSGDKSANAAIKQIQDKCYQGAFLSYPGKKLIVCINYDKKRKKHSCVIEEI